MLNSILKARGVYYSFQSGSLAFFALAILLPLVAPGKQISVSPLPISSYADTEVSTNIVFNRCRSDVKKFELKFTLDCSPSNCIQVALGTDVDGDGDLSFAETGAVYGWRNGRYFIEDIVVGKRYQQSIDADERIGTQIFSINMHTTRDYLPKTFWANIDGVSVFYESLHNRSHMALSAKVEFDENYPPRCKHTSGMVQL